MGTINSNEELNIIGGSYPDLGFAFNPLSIAVETTKDMELKMEVSCDGSTPISVVRNTFNNKVVFDLSGIARSFFDREEFKRVREKTYSMTGKIVKIRTIDEELYRLLNIELKIENKTFLTESIPVLWGALQIGEEYTQSKKLKAFRGYPFSFSLFSVENMTNILNRYNGENFEDYAELESGKYNLNFDRVAPDYDQVNSVDYVIDKGINYSVFSDSFDYTFRGFGVDSVQIHIDVEDVCDNEQHFYLRWINRWGEWNYYLFHQKSESNQTTDNTVQFDQYFTSINFDDKGYHPGTGGSIGKTVKRTIGLYASLVDSDTFNFLSQAVQSPVVDLFMGYEDDIVKTEKWMNVRTQAGTFAKSSDHLQDFELNLILPEIFTQNL